MVSKKIFAIGFTAVLLLLVSLIRPMNYDEAYYIESARLLSCGETPYSDFHFHMMPLLIILYAPFSFWGFWSYLIIKIVSVIFIFFTFLIYYRYLRYNDFGRKEISFFSILFFLNSFYLDWTLTIKIYSLSAFLFAGYAVYFGKFISGNSGFKNLYLCSLFVILLFLLKHSFLGNLAVFLGFQYYILRKRNPDGYIKPFTISLSILIIPLLIFLILYAGELENLYFEIIESNIIMQGHNHPFTLSKVFLPFLVPQNLILALIVVFSGFKYSLFEKFIILNISIFIIIHSVTSIIPEYYSTFIPVLIFLAILRFEKFIYVIKTRFPILSANRIIYIVVFIYLLSIPFGISSFKYIFEKRPLALNALQMYELRKIINNIQGKTVLASWEGYSIYSAKAPLMTEHYISSFLREYMTPGEMKLHKISTYDDFRNQILNEIPDIIVYDTINPAHLKGMKDLIESKYLKEAEYKFVIIYRRS